MADDAAHDQLREERERLADRHQQAYQKGRRADGGEQPGQYGLRIDEPVRDLAHRLGERGADEIARLLVAGGFGNVAAEPCGVLADGDLVDLS